MEWDGKGREVLYNLGFVLYNFYLLTFAMQRKKVNQKVYLIDI
jgi:hypothetical protein